MVYAGALKRPKVKAFRDWLMEQIKPIREEDARDRPNARKQRAGMRSASGWSTVVLRNMRAPVRAWGAARPANAGGSRTSLDMPLEADLDGEYLEGHFQEKIGDRRLGGLLTNGRSNTATTLKGERKLELYFSKRRRRRRIFWIRENRPLNGPNDPTSVDLAVQQAEGGLCAGRSHDRRSDGGGSVILVMPTTACRPDSRTGDAGPDPQPAEAHLGPVLAVLAMDLQERATILGPDFRGAVVMINVFQGKLTNLQAELIDLHRAQTVLNLISR